MLDVVKLDGNILCYKVFFVFVFFYISCSSLVPVCYQCHFNACLQAAVGT